MSNYFFSKTLSYNLKVMKKHISDSYAQTWQEMYNSLSRQKKAKRMVKVFQDFLGLSKLKKLRVLDVGCSTGIIDNTLSAYFKEVVGIDSDSQAINFANKTFKNDHLKFMKGDALSLSFADNSFDVVICAHIYEHVPNSKKLFKEIYRVLKPGGICYVAAINKLWPIEPHYFLPGLDWFPKKIANAYLKLLKGIPVYDINPLSYWGLKSITKNFEITEYTQKIVTNPRCFEYENIPVVNILGWNLFSLFSPFVKYLAPTFFWLLVKPNKLSSDFPAQQSS